MKSLKLALIFILISNSSLLFSQSYPVGIDLKSKGVKLDAKLYLTDKTNKAPSVILLHGFPGNQSSPLGLAERLNSAGFNILVFNYQGSYLSEGIFVGWQDKTSFLEVNTLPLYRKLQQLNAENISIKGFESDHRFNNVIDDITNTIIDWIINNAL